MARLGKQFELVVSDVIREFGPGTKVSSGKWVKGPDGRRDIDVLVEGELDGKNQKILIECKDFSTNTTGRVGIPIVDALDSKRRDLDIKIALICSNAGFTTPAISKAKRVGIGLIGVLREGDKRIRYKILDEIYFREIRKKILNFDLYLNGEKIPPNGLDFFDVCFNNRPIGNWVIDRTIAVIAENPIVRGWFRATFDMRERILLEAPSGELAIDRLEIYAEISGGWFAQRVTIDATSGLYDWLSKQLRPASRKCVVKFHDVDRKKGRKVRSPPNFDPIRPGFKVGKTDLILVFIEGL